MDSMDPTQRIVQRLQNTSFAHLAHTRILRDQLNYRYSIQFEQSIPFLAVSYNANSIPVSFHWTRQAPLRTKFVNLGDHLSRISSSNGVQKLPERVDKI